MKRHLHLVATALFVLCLLFDAMVWGAVANLSDVGPAIALSARNEAPIAATYIAIGTKLDAVLPALGTAGTAVAAGALGDGFGAIRDEPSAAIDLIFSHTWNSLHRWVKTLYWGAPLLLIVSLILWGLKPKPITLMGGKRR